MNPGSPAKPVGEITRERILAGELTLDEVRVTREVLESQAAIASERGNPQLGENLLRAAELRQLPDHEVLTIYEALRPGRSTHEELSALSAGLTARGLSRCAALINEALDAYDRRGLLG